MSHKTRYAANKDLNENQIVDALRAIGCSVRTGVDDIFVGYLNGGVSFNFWYELKSENALKKDGNFKKGAVKESQEKIRVTWGGHYKIVSSLKQIINDMNKVFKRCGLRTVKIR